MVFFKYMSINMMAIIRKLSDNWLSGAYRIRNYFKVTQYSFINILYKLLSTWFTNVTRSKQPISKDDSYFKHITYLVWLPSFWTFQTWVIISCFIQPQRNCIFSIHGISDFYRASRFKAPCIEMFKCFLCYKC